MAGPIQLRSGVSAAATVALVALGSFGWTPAAEARRTFAPPGLVADAVVEDGGVFYRSFTRTREVIKRLDLKTGKREVIYGHRLEPFSISGVRAGGGRVVIEISAPRDEDFVSKVLALAPRGGDPTVIAAARLVMRDNGPDCGGVVVLKDVAPNGEILTEEGTASCDEPQRNFATLKVYSDGVAREVGRQDVEDVIDLESGPARKLAAGRLLTWTETGGMVADLATGSTRSVARRGRRWSFQDVDLDSAGNVLVTELIFGRRHRYREAVRLVRPTDPPAGGTLLFRSRRGYELARFCGDSLAEYSLSGRGVERLRVRADVDSAPRLLHRGRNRTRGEFSFESACDESAFALLRSSEGSERTRIESFFLTGVGARDEAKAREVRGIVWAHDWTHSEETDGYPSQVSRTRASTAWIRPPLSDRKSPSVGTARSRSSSDI